MIVFTIIIFLNIIMHAAYRVYYSLKNGTFGLFEFTLFFFSFIYAIVPLFILYSRSFVLNFYTLIPGNTYIIESIFILLAYICLFIGGNSMRKTGWYISTKPASQHSIFKYAIILFIFALFFWIVYVRLYGGLEYIMKNISAIRSGYDENKNYLGAFFLMLSKLSFISFLCMLFLQQKHYFKGKSILYNMFFYIIIGGTFLSILMGGGRSNIILLLIYILLTIYLLRRKILLSYIVIFVFFALFIIFFGKTFLFLIFNEQYDLSFYEVRSLQEQKGFINLLIYEFNHPFLSFSNFLQNNYEYRYFKDYVIWVLKPMKLLYPNETFYDSISYYNTFLLNSQWESNIPPGFVALGYMNGGVFGLLIQSLLTGRIFKWIDLLIKNSNLENNATTFIIYVISFQCVMGALNGGDIALQIQALIPYFILLFIMLVLKKVRLKKRVYIQ